MLQNFMGPLASSVLPDAPPPWLAAIANAGSAALRGGFEDAKPTEIYFPFCKSRQGDKSGKQDSFRQKLLVTFERFSSLFEPVDDPSITVISPRF